MSMVPFSGSRGGLRQSARDRLLPQRASSRAVERQWREHDEQGEVEFHQMEVVAANEMHAAGLHSLINRNRAEIAARDADQLAQTHEAYVLRRVQEGNAIAAEWEQSPTDASKALTAPFATTWRDIELQRQRDVFRPW